MRELIAERELVETAGLCFVRYQLAGRTHLAGPDHWNALHANVEIVEAAEVLRR